MRSQFWDWGALERSTQQEKKWKMRACKNCTDISLVYKFIQLESDLQVDRATATKSDSFLEMLKGANDSNDSVFVFIGNKFKAMRRMSAAGVLASYLF